MAPDENPSQPLQWLTHFGTLELDIVTGQLNCSDTACRIFETTPESAPATLADMLALIHPEDRDTVSQTHQTALQTLLPWDIEYRLLFSDGRIKYIQEYGEISLDEQKKPRSSIRTIYDITHHRQAEQALLESEQRFQRLAEISPVGIFRTDNKGQCLYVNQSWCQMAGITDQQALGDGWSTAIHPQDRERVFHEWQQAAENGQMPFSSECRFQQPDGTITWVLCQADAERDREGNISGYVGTVTNISDSKDTETALRQIAETVSGIGDDKFFDLITQKLCRLFHVDYAFIGLLDKDNPMQINTLSLAVRGKIHSNISYNLRGTPCENVVAKTTCVHPSGVSEEFSDDQLLIDMGVDSYIGTPLFDPQGKPLGLVVLLHSQPLQQLERIQPIMEIAAARIAAEMERQQSEKNLLKSRELLHAVFDASPDLIFIQSAEGSFLDANKRALQTYGLNKTDLHKYAIKDLSAPGYNNERARDHIIRALQGQPEDFEWVARKVSGEVFPVEVRLRRLKDKATKSEPALVTVVRDISQQKKTKEAFDALSMGVMGSRIEDYLQQTLQNLAQVFNARYAFIGRLQEPDNTHVQTLCVWANNSVADNFRYALEGTPCKDTLNHNTKLIPAGVYKQYPKDSMLEEMQVESYYGQPLISSSGKTMGLLSILDDKPMAPEPWAEPVLKIFATRLANEIERHEATQALKYNEAHLEKLVEDRTQELENINRELEAFSYSVSHDLRTPLRTLDGFSQLLLEDYGPSLDETAKNYLQRIRHGAQRMGEIIENLLSLSRVSRSELKLTHCNLSELARTSINQLMEQHPGRQIELVINDDMTAFADEKLISIVLDNLLGNAWKYTAKNSHTHIEFDTSNHGQETVFHIRDNGAGFDMRYADKLFSAFQRLHGAEFEGTGIGLATVQRIIHRHGGRIWAEAELDKGACFYFTLPNTSPP